MKVVIKLIILSVILLEFGLSLFVAIQSQDQNQHAFNASVFTGVVSFFLGAVVYFSLRNDFNSKKNV